MSSVSTPGRFSTSDQTRRAACSLMRPFRGVPRTTGTKYGLSGSADTSGRYKSPAWRLGRCGSPRPGVGSRSVAEILALVAAFFFALAATLQQKGALGLEGVSLGSPKSLLNLVKQNVVAPGHGRVAVRATRSRRSRSRTAGSRWSSPCS